MTLGASTFKTTFIGGSLSLFSGLLFTVNRALHDLTGLHFTDTLLAIFTFRSVSFFVILAYLSYCTSTQNGCEDNGERTSLCIYKVDKDKNVNVIRILLILQGLFGGFNNLGAFVAVTMMPIGDAHALIFSAPFPTMLLSSVIFQTKIRIYKFLCAISVLTGIILIAKPSYIFGEEHFVQKTNKSIIINDDLNSTFLMPLFQNMHIYDTHYHYGVAAAMFASISRGCQSITISYLYTNKSTQNASLIGLYAGIGGLLVPIIAILANMEEFSTCNQNLSARSLYSLLCIGIFGTAGTFMLIKSIEIIGSVLESFFRTSDIMVAYFIQVLLFHEEVNVLSLVGSAAIVASIMLMSIEDIFVKKMSIQFLKNIL